MCWEMDYQMFSELKKAQEAKAKQEQRAGVIDKLLIQASEQVDKANVDATPLKEVVPAK